MFDRIKFHFEADGEQRTLPGVVLGAERDDGNCFIAIFGCPEIGGNQFSGYVTRMAKKGDKAGEFQIAGG